MKIILESLPNLATEPAIIINSSYSRRTNGEFVTDIDHLTKQRQNVKRWYRRYGFHCRQKFAYLEFHIPLTDRRPRAGYGYQVKR
jgi:hypothetical protein